MTTIQDLQESTSAKPKLTRTQLAAIPVDLAEWVCPMLCGCRILIEAKWLDGDIQENGLSFRHPIPFTIKSIELASCCEQHQPALQYDIKGCYEHLFTKTIQTSFSRDELLVSNTWGNKVQVAGYLKYPIHKPTPVERLYTYLWRYGGTLWIPSTCTCNVYQSFDRLDSERKTYILEHPVWSKWCLKHKFNHQAALLENQSANRNDSHK